jgi:hypothetical protein
LTSKTTNNDLPDPDYPLMGPFGLNWTLGLNSETINKPLDYVDLHTLVLISLILDWIFDFINPHFDILSVPRGCPNDCPTQTGI